MAPNLNTDFWQLFLLIFSPIPMISSDHFAHDLEKFVDSYAQTDAEAIFKLYKNGNRVYAEQRELIIDSVINQQVHRLISITYNEAYGVPTMWFNFYHPSGKLLYLEDFEHLIQTNSTSTDILKGLSQNEHPIHGIAFYNIHPCRTSDVMKEFITCNFITSWLSIYGAILGLDVSDVAKNTFSDGTHSL